MGMTGIAHASVLTALATGLSLGVLHILTGPDHLGALAALSSGRPWREALKLGIQWGCGHSVGIAVVAVVALAIGHALDLTVLREVCNYLTGIFLLLLGAWTLYSGISTYRSSEAAAEVKASSEWSKVKCQDASYIQLPPDGSCRDPHLLELQYHDHCHSHSHLCDLTSYCSPAVSSSAVASVCVGVVHGIAGPGEMLGVLPVLAIHHVAPAVAYLVGFSISSAVGMGVFAAVYGEVTRSWALKSSSVALGVAAGSGLLSMGVGVVWIVLQATGSLDHVFGDDDSR